MILKMEVAGQACGSGMHMQMQNAETLSPNQIREFLKLSREIEFTAQNRAEV
jgi:hypothetical protein